MTGLGFTAVVVFLAKALALVFHVSAVLAVALTADTRVGVGGVGCRFPTLT